MEGRLADGAGLERYRARPPDQSGSANLAYILERVLDKGIVIAGDIQINLLDIELLTIKMRLLVASLDRAREMGIDWWESDPTLSSRARRELTEENRDLRERLEQLERTVGRARGGGRLRRAPRRDRRRGGRGRRRPRGRGARRGAREGPLDPGRRDG